MSSLSFSQVQVYTPQFAKFSAKENELLKSYRQPVVKVVKINLRKLLGAK